MITPNANAQENPAADIIKKSQENLKKFENKTIEAAKSQPSSSQKAPVTVSPLPKPTADFYQL